MSHPYTVIAGGYNATAFNGELLIHTLANGNSLNHIPVGYESVP